MLVCPLNEYLQHLLVKVINHSLIEEDTHSDEPWVEMEWTLTILFYVLEDFGKLGQFLYFVGVYWIIEAHDGHSGMDAVQILIGFVVF